MPKVNKQSRRMRIRASSYSQVTDFHSQYTTCSNRRYIEYLLDVMWFLWKHELAKVWLMTIFRSRDINNWSRRAALQVQLFLHSWKIIQHKNKSFIKLSKSKPYTCNSHNIIQKNDEVRFICLQNISVIIYPN